MPPPPHPPVYTQVRNPCYHVGDIRVLAPVDVQELRHLRDCLVLPVNGPRPHMDEACGGMHSMQQAQINEPGQWMQRKASLSGYSGNLVASQGDIAYSGGVRGGRQGRDSSSLLH